MKSKNTIYCGIFIFLTSLLLTVFNLYRSGILEMFFPSQNSSGIGNFGGSLISLVLFILPVLGLGVGLLLITVGIFKSFKKTKMP